MRQREGRELKPLETSAPEGITLSVGEAARILGTSSSTLKRRACEWGLRTFWDRRGRRYSIQELREVKEGLLKPQEPSMITQDLTAIQKYDLPGGYRFRVYRTDEDKGYVGFFAFEGYDDIIPMLRYAIGAGTYYLKLLDGDNRMTRYTFAVDLRDPDDEERRQELEELRAMKIMTKHYKDMTKYYKDMARD